MIDQSYQWNYNLGDHFMLFEVDFCGHFPQDTFMPITILLESQIVSESVDVINEVGKATVGGLFQ